MKKKILILVGLFIVFVVFMIPAKLIENTMPPQKNIALNGFSGSIWSGKISQIITPQINLNDVSFSTGATALLMAKLSLDLVIPKGDVKGDFNVTLGSDYQNNIELNDANMTIKSIVLKSLIPVNNAAIDGVINTHDLNLILKNNKPSFIEGRVDWKNASVSYAGESWALGDFVVDLSTDDKKVIHGKLVKSNNKLSLDGSFTLTENGALEIIGSIATDIDQRVYQAFALFNNGKPANGRLPIKFKQKIF